MKRYLSYFWTVCSGPQEKQSLRVLCLLVLLFLLCVPVFAQAATGEVWQVKGKVVNVRGGPSTKKSVVAKVRKGAKVTELKRQGKWLEVEMADGAVGWMHIALLTGPLSKPPEALVAAQTQSEEAQTTAKKMPASLAFKAFKAELKDMSDQAEKAVGLRFYAGTNHISKGVVEVLVTDLWLSSAKETQAANLQKIFTMWASRNKGRAVKVKLVDSRGKVVRSKASQ